jgi:cell division septation protein DedD
MQPKDTSMKKITITKPEQAQTAIKSDTLQSQKVVEEKKTNLESYSIVLASYITKKNANAFVEDLHKKGFSEAEVFIRNNVTRVIFGSFKTENEAYNKLRTLRGEKNFEEAWVMKI